MSGPILYVIWKKMYGGLAKKDPVEYPVNRKTGLAHGDLKRIAGMFFVLAIVGFVAYPWLKWFEGDWAEEYYSRDLQLRVPGELRLHAHRDPDHRRGLPRDRRRLLRSRP